MATKVNPQELWLKAKTISVEMVHLNQYGASFKVYFYTKKGAKIEMEDSKNAGERGLFVSEKGTLNLNMNGGAKLKIKMKVV